MDLDSGLITSEGGQLHIGGEFGVGCDRGVSVVRGHTVFKEANGFLRPLPPI